MNDFGENVFLSFDIDSICSSYCPGVSCPGFIFHNILGIVGLTAQEAFDICFEAGKNPKVKMFDLSEYNPKIEEYRTGKLVSFMFYYFAMGLSLRISQNESK
jgi:formiminoglutamase